jgi:hypothetical protein
MYQYDCACGPVTGAVGKKMAENEQRTTKRLFSMSELPTQSFASLLKVEKIQGSSSILKVLSPI